MGCAAVEPERALFLLSSLWPAKIACMENSCEWLLHVCGVALYGGSPCTTLPLQQPLRPSLRKFSDFQQWPSPSGDWPAARCAWPCFRLLLMRQPCNGRHDRNSLCIQCIQCPGMRPHRRARKATRDSGTRKPTGLTHSNVADLALCY